jgi:hypothetical protein
MAHEYSRRRCPRHPAIELGTRPTYGIASLFLSRDGRFGSNATAAGRLAASSAASSFPERACRLSVAAGLVSRRGALAPRASDLDRRRGARKSTVVGRFLAATKCPERQCARDRAHARRYRGPLTFTIRRRGRGQDATAFERRRTHTAASNPTTTHRTPRRTAANPRRRARVEAWWDVVKLREAVGQMRAMATQTSATEPEVSRQAAPRVSRAEQRSGVRCNRGGRSGGNARARMRRALAPTSTYNQVEGVSPGTGPSHSVPRPVRRMVRTSPTR